MYAQHFGLKKRPFRASATGTDVFVGPQIAVTMAGLKKALSGSDTVVTVSGPVGSGKTTLVNRALESIDGKRKTVLVARMRLDSTDVLEFLLDELGVQERPNGTIQRFALFRRHLKKLADVDTQVCIAVEDAIRLGVDTLAEIEALTAADAGESEGANVVLMGDDALDTMLRETSLARLQQRIRQRLAVAALPAAEMRGYLRHCFRLAGRDFEQIFEPNAAGLLHHLSNGVPRISNNLVESAMTAAADQDLAQVATTLLARVAENEYGLSAADFELAANVEAAIPKLAIESHDIEAVTAADPVMDPEAEQAKVAEVLPVPELTVENPAAVSAEPCEAAPQQVKTEAEVPELIQDTLPDLAILAPELAAAAVEPAPEAVPVLTPEPKCEPVVATAPVPEVVPEPEPVPVRESVAESESSDDDVPAWERDPTMAELKPDLAALEQAMSFAQDDSPDPVADDPEPLPTPEPEEPEVIPEITLDHAISQRIESELIDEPGETSAPKTEEVPASANDADMSALNLPKKQDKKADVEMEKIAAELAKAKSLEDVNDKLAETLFGDEINFIAAQVIANPPSAESANDELECAVAAEQPVATDIATEEVEVTLEVPPELGAGSVDLSASQRLKTVRALNANLHPSIREPEKPVDGHAPPVPELTPEPIEEQINTSLTQTLKALNVTPPIAGDDDDEESNGGFFSRFKRS